MPLFELITLIRAPTLTRSLCKISLNYKVKYSYKEKNESESLFGFVIAIK